MVDLLDASNLHAIARGCAVLGAGGGGDPELGLVMALRAVEEEGPVCLLSLAELPPGELLMPCGLVGAPVVATERVWGAHEGHSLRAEVEMLHGRRVGALMCLEIGGVNGLLAITWAARLGLPLLDADGGGRAFPELQQSAMNLAEVPAGPVVLTDGRGNSIILRCEDAASAERLARKAAASLGGVCAAALYCMMGEQARDAVIAGSVTRALELGEAMSIPAVGRRLTAIGMTLAGVLLAEGRVAHVQREAEHGFVHGSATVRGIGADGQRHLRLEMQNEYLLAIEDGEVRATVPDIISVHAWGRGDPIATERLRYGDRVSVIAWPAPEIWRSDPGLLLVGPAAFGYEVDYSPLAGVARA